MLVKHLARYFARCWSKPQSVNREIRAEKQQGIRERLARLMEASSQFTVPKSKLSKLMDTLPALFSPDYPQVLTHGDFSVTNILVDENEFEIVGIVDWSLAAMMPFGMDLDIGLITGFMTRDGWRDYACKSMLQDTFWDEFWAESGIEESELRARIHILAKAASTIAAILRLAFRCNADGSPSEEVLISESSVEQLKAWFGDEQ
ncbi:hypothetical protein C2857_004392 [Epichloe festucae Fl1]|uniref:Aminoglycoside phosphotransferase domain-containing protein n=1 Tax=Epichloe festucae (strain Fl1) TaxID=877507 RepID=A0A7U3SNN9_EPIFF|nr:hypothetical protein C2857_004392 [Epichloe festucae Fl1]